MALKCMNIQVAQISFGCSTLITFSSLPLSLFFGLRSGILISLSTFIPWTGSKHFHLFWPGSKRAERTDCPSDRIPPINFCFPLIAHCDGRCVALIRSGRVSDWLPPSPLSSSWCAVITTLFRFFFLSFFPLQSCNVSYSLCFSFIFFFLLANVRKLTNSNAITMTAARQTAHSCCNTPNSKCIRS